MWMQLSTVNVMVCDILTISNIGIGSGQRFVLFCVVCEHPDSGALGL